MPESKPKNPEAQLNETIALIEKGIEDIKNEKATKSEVIALIDERVKADKEVFKSAQDKTDKAVSELEQLKIQSESLKSQLKAMLQGGLSSLKGPDGAYNGRFASVQEAKAFGLLIMAGTLAGTKQTEKFETVKKSLEKMGIDPYWVDSSGKKTMTGSSATGGAALVTVEQSPSFIRLLETYGRFRANATVMPMGAGQTTVPKIDSLLTFYCPGEGGTVNEDDPKIAVLNLVPKTICALTAYSLELEEDSAIALGELMGDLFARSAAYYEDLCGFLGDGTSTYFGFKGVTPALLAVSTTIASIKSLVVGSGNAYSELALVDFEGVAGILPDYADNLAKWFVHRYFYYTVMVKLAMAAGGASATEIIIGAGQRQKSFLSYPVEFTQVMPRAEANSQICALLADLKSGAMLGTRGGFEFAQSAERYFEKGLVAVRGRERIAINAHGVGDTTKAGPICGLITAAS